MPGPSHDRTIITFDDGQVTAVWKISSLAGLAHRDAWQNQVMHHKTMAKPVEVICTRSGVSGSPTPSDFKILHKFRLRQQSEIQDSKGTFYPKNPCQTLLGIDQSPGLRSKN